MAAVTYSPAAEDDLAEIAAYVARDKPAAARRLVTQIRGACETLAANPGLGQQRPDFGVPGCRVLCRQIRRLFSRCR